MTRISLVDPQRAGGLAGARLNLHLALCYEEDNAGLKRAIRRVADRCDPSAHA